MLHQDMMMPFVISFTYTSLRGHKYTYNCGDINTQTTVGDFNTQTTVRTLAVDCFFPQVLLECFFLKFLIDCCSYHNRYTFTTFHACMQNCRMLSIIHSIVLFFKICVLIRL